MSDNSFELVWEVRYFMDDHDMPSVIKEIQRDGWEVHSIHLEDRKIIVKKSMRVRLDD
tara:strand:+ start:723 stop:896 length:174 start_codon:yes stop_codon:yes gene_type:complete